MIYAKGLAFAKSFPFQTVALQKICLCKQARIGPIIHGKRLSLGVLSGISVELLNKVAPLLILHLAEDRLGVRGFGYALFGISFIELVLPLIVFGYHHLGAVEIAAHRSDQRYIGQTMVNIVGLRFLHSLVVVAGIGIFLSFYQAYAPYRSLILALSITLFFAPLEAIWVHVAVQRVALVNLAVGLGRFISLALIYLMVSSPDDAILFAVLNLASSLFINLVTFAAARRKFPAGWPEWQGMKSLFRRAAPFAGILFFMVYFERVDMLIVEHFLGSDGAGLYAGPARMGHSLYQVAQAIVVAFFSEMIVARSREALSRHLELGVWVLGAFLSPIVAGVWFTDAALVTFIFGEEFRAVARLLGVVVASVALSVGISAFGLQVLVVRGRIRTFALCLLIGAIVGTLLAYLGMRAWGPLGLAVGLAVGKALSLLLILKVVRGYVTHLGLVGLCTSVVPAAVMALGLYLVEPEGLLLTLGLGGFIYGSLLILLNHRKLKQLRRLPVSKP